MLYFSVIAIYAFITIYIYYNWAFYKKMTAPKQTIRKSIFLILISAFTIFVIHLCLGSYKNLTQDFSTIDSLVALTFTIVTFYCSISVARNEEE